MNANSACGELCPRQFLSVLNSGRGVSRDLLRTAGWRRLRLTQNVRSRIAHSSYKTHLILFFELVFEGQSVLFGIAKLNLCLL